MSSMRRCAPPNFESDSIPQPASGVTPLPTLSSGSTDEDIALACKYRFPQRDERKCPSMGFTVKRVPPST